jgi:parallel beta helix pectate lyase-like protein
MADWFGDDWTMRTAIMLAALAVLTGAIGSRPVAGQSDTNIIYVDSKISLVACPNYSVAGRACSNGRETAYKSLASAAARAESGTTVLIREGTYRESLAPARSGSSERPIVFRNYEGETATITGVDAPAIQIIGKQWIVVDGLTVTDTTGWARLQDASHNVVQHMTFLRAQAEGTTGGLKIVRSTFNRIIENSLEDGNDNLLLQDSSNGNVIFKNVLRTARHTLLVIKCSSFNVVRENLLVNASQKGMEIFDCEGGSDAPTIYDTTRRNVVERNIFAISRGSSRVYMYNAIQHGGQYTIVRRNAFLNDLGGGVNYQQYPEESLYVYGNRLYHNTFYGNRCFALVGNTGDPSKYYDNRAVNNLFYKNRDCEGRGDQISIAASSSVIAESNAVETKDPGFVDEAKPDLRLKADSPMIDRAGALTTTSRAGQGNELPVRDVMWFYDGYTIPGELGDEIQLLGTTDTARVVSINYKANLLVLDRALSWRVGQGVALKFAGLAPDYGADEAGLNPPPDKSEPERRSGALKK